MLFLLIAFQIPFRVYLLKRGPQGYSRRIEAFLYWPVPLVVAILVINWLATVLS